MDTRLRLSHMLELSYRFRARHSKRNLLRRPHWSRILHGPAALPFPSTLNRDTGDGPSTSDLDRPTKTKIPSDNARARKRKQKKAYKKRKKIARRLELQNQPLSYSHRNATIVYVDYKQVRATELGYLGPRCKTSKVCSLQQAMAMGHSKLEWNGRNTTLLVDRSSQKILSILAGHDADPTHLSNFYEAENILRGARSRTRFTQKEICHRRGQYETLTYGYSYGGGQTSPQFLKTGGYTKVKAAADMYNSSPVQNIIEYHNKCLKTFAPRLALRYGNLLRHLNTREAKRNHYSSPPQFTLSPDKDAFAATTFNIGRCVSTVLHYDCQNFGPGLCVISSFGHYDYKKGGHLILCELGLIVEFPPYSTILIPSAIVKHGNTPIAAHEDRMSVTQYTAGGLLRWAACAFKSAKANATNDLPTASKTPLDMLMTVQEFNSKRYTFIQDQCP